MIQQLIPVKKENRSGVLIAIALFILQFVFYQMQGSIQDNLSPLIKGIEGVQVLGITINNAGNAVILLPIAVHTLFSVVIIWFLYKDREGTKVVLYISLILIVLYLVTLYIGKVSEFYPIQSASVGLKFFLASPFKTIFSIPMLKIKHPGEEIKSVTATDNKYSETKAIAAKREQAISDTP